MNMKEDPPAPAPEKNARVQEVKFAKDNEAVDELKREVVRLTGRTEDLERELKSLRTQPQDDSRKKQEEYQRGLENRILELEQAQLSLIESLKKNQKAPPSDPATTYEKATKAYKSKDYETSIELFGQILKAPKSKFSEESYFLRAEAYHAIQQHKKAILDYSVIREKYPKSKRLPQSLLKIAMCFEALGLKDDAKVFYQELRDQFPNSSEAKALKKK
jgi:tol-pal system protein YbgF